MTMDGLGATQRELNLRWGLASDTIHRWLGRSYSAYCNSGSSVNLSTYFALFVFGRLPKNVIVPSVDWGLHTSYSAGSCRNSCFVQLLSGNTPANAIIPYQKNGFSLLISDGTGRRNQASGNWPSGAPS